MTNTHNFGKIAVIEELKKRWNNVIQSTHKEYRGILADGLKIETKSCNYDNKWAQKDNVLGGWDRINPDKFDYLVCVAFDKSFENVRYFIFSKQEAELFPKVVWKNTPNLKNLTLINGEEQTDKIVEMSEGRWDKIIL